MQETIDLAN